MILNLLRSQCPTDNVKRTSFPGVFVLTVPVAGRSIWISTTSPSIISVSSLQTHKCAQLTYWQKAWNDAWCSDKYGKVCSVKQYMLPAKHKIFNLLIGSKDVKYFPTFYLTNRHFQWSDNWEVHIPILV